MKRETPNHKGRGLEEMRRAAPFFAFLAPAVKRLFVALAVHEMVPAALVAFMLRVLRLGGA